MWVYWLSLGFISALLYFPFKRFLSREIAIRSSIATFIIGSIYPLLRTNLSTIQILLALGLLLLFLGITIVKSHPDWEVTGEKEEPRELLEESKELSVEETVLPVSTNTEADFDINKTLDTNNYEDFTASEPILENDPIAKENTTEAIVEVNSSPIAEDKNYDDMETAIDTQEQIDQHDSFKMKTDLPAAQDSFTSHTVCEIVEPIKPETDIIEVDQSLETNTDIQTVELSDVTQVEEIDLDTPTSWETEQINTECPNTVIDNTDTSILEDNTGLYAKTTAATEVISNQQIIIEGLKLAKSKQYVQAVKTFNKVISSESQPELLYIAISELSTIYQHLGLYPMASDIILSFMEHPSLINHPGMENLKQKVKFIVCLTQLLSKYHYGQIPYEQVPEAVRREAFDNSLNIKQYFLKK